MKSFILFLLFVFFFYSLPNLQTCIERVNIVARIFRNIHREKRICIVKALFNVYK